LKFEEEEVVDALDKLSKGKAAGHDLLKDTQIKLIQKETSIIKKLTNSF
jgi:hypothetical protein